MEYKIIYSDRKTLAAAIERDGSIVVKAPKGITEEYIRGFIEKYEDRIIRAQKKAEEKKEIRKDASPEEEKELRRLAKSLLPEKVKYYSSLIGVTPLRITVTGAKTRFGSCSGKNSISFSFYLMRYPEEAVDYVVVHELCHIIHHNHSAAFYKEVEKILPDYKRREKILRTYTGKAPGQEN